MLRFCKRSSHLSRGADPFLLTAAFAFCVWSRQTCRPLIKYGAFAAQGHVANPRWNSIEEQNGSLKDLAFLVVQHHPAVEDLRNLGTDGRVALTFSGLQIRHNSLQYLSLRLVQPSIY